MTAFELTADEPDTSGSAPTDAHRAMTALLARVVIEVARRRQDELSGLTETLQDRVLVTTGETSRRAYGWFEPDAWRHGEQAVSELFVNADFADHAKWISPAENVLVTLLHEACHVYADANKIKDTSRDGRYHNRRFGELALCIGLQIERDRQTGVRTPQLSARGAADYRDLIEHLESGLVVVRRPRTLADADAESSKSAPEASADGSGLAAGPAAPAPRARYVFASCGCRMGRRPVTLRVAQGSWRPGVIRCTACGQPFTDGGV
ncbi:hypothetical protein AMES_2105 [Amycolatopsis mediterranei S699]|uniref:SprT-like domain-containing protein n=2 Tax=Amycolatopsis mediterranei TaxID=33910 RepID=A0A0H3CZZ8_AMYMU|nr:hypothetical protein [Amycolatopsis mediterranei]ADJ43928.1 conserved hypothetical protein [Amycolatopsis mediterranei U32]AEK40649.1 hypothetical protein RAM_10795 [Amycolatopsis mediterranei S699]AFO75641.1 hypothetical protein AMES_2105 [Amycolatopsis mediterranei S699]AGT82770.1 hypothetical protein B737_2106 [Amycolatopsis mediterranei RB]KDO04277.1 hypothetical protein DV26_44835 [Amycolatopsis mediterranei]